MIIFMNRLKTEKHMIRAPHMCVTNFLWYQEKLLTGSLSAVATPFSLE